METHSGTWTLISDNLSHILKDDLHFSQERWGSSVVTRGAAQTTLLKLEYYLI